MGKFWAWLMTAAAKAWPILWRYFAPMLRDGVREQWEILLPMAERYVVAIEQSFGWAPKSGDAKKAAVMALITKELIDKEYAWAKTIPSRMINRAIEDVLDVLPAKPSIISSGPTAPTDASAAAPVITS